MERLGAWGRGLAAVCCAAALSACQKGAPQAEVPGVRQGTFLKGVNFTAEPPAGYDSETAAATMDRLPEFGINAVALVPYAAARLGSPELRFPLGMEGDAGIRRMAEAARAAGLKVILKPQVWYRGGFPGEHELKTPREREAFFRRYGDLVDHYARLAEDIDADVFCVGVEFAQLTKYDDRWRELIRRARKRYSGPLTYAANFGKEFESIAFWDALDYIGLDDYYPLPADLSTEAVARKVEAVYGRYGKPVILTEVGFSSYEKTNERPWENRPSETYSAEAQAAAYEAVLRGFHDKPWLQGMFWWKVGSNGAPSRRDDDHTPWGKPAMDVLKSWYLRL